MDRQGRLTRLDEWRVGQLYRWRKGGVNGEAWRCAAVNRRGGFIRLEREGSAGSVCFLNWHHRFLAEAEVAHV